MTDDLINMNQEDLMQSLIQETDDQKLKDIVSVFNRDLQKKNMVRVIKYNELSDKLLDQIETRIDKKPGEFSNDELLKYLQVIQNYAGASSDIINPDKVPKIQINNTKIDTVENVSLNRESKEKVMNAVDSILAQLKLEELMSNDSIDTEAVDLDNLDQKEDN